MEDLLVRDAGIVPLVRSGEPMDQSRGSPEPRQVGNHGVPERLRQVLRILFAVAHEPALHDPLELLVPDLQGLERSSLCGIRRADEELRQFGQVRFVVMVLHQGDLRRGGVLVIDPPRESHDSGGVRHVGVAVADSRQRPVDFHHRAVVFPPCGLLEPQVGVVPSAGVDDGGPPYRASAQAFPAGRVAARGLVVHVHPHGGDLADAGGLPASVRPQPHPEVGVLLLGDERVYVPGRGDVGGSGGGEMADQDHPPSAVLVQVRQKLRCPHGVTPVLGTASPPPRRCVRASLWSSGGRVPRCPPGIRSAPGCRPGRARFDPIS